MIEFAGRTLVNPIVRNGESLSQSLKKYFPKEDPELWFSWNEAKQNEWIRGLLRERCPVFGAVRDGEQLQAHHMWPKGMGSKDCVKVPWAMIPAMRSFDPKRSFHSLLEAPSSAGYRVVHWDFLDLEGGLEVVDQEGHAIPHEDLYFYNRPHPVAVKAAEEWKALILKANAKHVAAAYELGALASLGQEYHEILGAKSVNDWAAQHGIQTPPLKQGVRVMDTLFAFWDRMKEALVPMPIADFFRKRIPEEEWANWIDNLCTYCSPLAEHPSIAAFIELVDEAFPAAERMKKLSIVPEETEVEAVKVASVSEVIGKGKVIKGWPVREEGE